MRIRLYGGVRGRRRKPPPTRSSMYLQAGKLRNKLNGERIKKAKAEGKSPEGVELRPISFDTYDDAIRKKGK